MERQTRPARGQVAASLRTVRGADAADYAASVAFLRRRHGEPITLQIEEHTPYTPQNASGSRLRRHFRTVRHLAALFRATRRDVLAVVRAIDLLAFRARVSVLQILRARPATGRRLVTLLYELARATVAATTAEQMTVTTATDLSVLPTAAEVAGDTILAEAYSDVSDIAAPDDATASMEMADAPVYVAEAEAISDAPAQDHPVVAAIVSAVASFTEKVADRIGSFAAKVTKFFRRTPAAEVSA